MSFFPLLSLYDLKRREIGKVLHKVSQIKEKTLPHLKGDSKDEEGEGRGRIGCQGQR